MIEITETEFWTIWLTAMGTLLIMLYYFFKLGQGLQSLIDGGEKLYE